MSAPEIIRDLVDRFHRNSDSYRSPVYNETQTRLEFINPMFKALGWDMDNEQGYAEAYKDVIHEDAIKIEGATKAPDYCFRVGGTRKFFLEAKKPAVNLAQDEASAFQLRRYAWSAKLPVSILTDFEEFIVYDCRLRPSVNDKTSKARVISLQYRDYVDKWSEIASIFSREAVLKGSFDKFAETALRKRGTAEVDEEFLAEIEMWRESLARNISLRNRTLTARELNYAVQLTIDRLIFLRICEDRRIESYGRLKQAATGSDVYNSLFQLFHQADQRYNSGLFHFQREKDRPSDIDSLTPNIRVDDKPLREIIKRLYYPESPYEFSVLPADILGHIYEQFLGKVITLIKGHQAKIEEKPEVRKAGGVYYTPTYIVNYIVKNTVGELLKDKTAGVKGTATKLRVLDPACGSGSFLLGAYQFLLDWHLEQYVKDDPQKLARGTNATIFQDKRGEWRLTTSERKRILLNNIYGVDIDSQAVEVTKLSLLLKVLEEESSETLEKNLKLFHERALPDLGDNIKCGNSLIAPDFYGGWQSDLFDEEEKYRVNVFDWKSEFKSILKDGGFDAIIGNPPYIRSQSLGEMQRDYYERRFSTSTGTYDIYVLFVERGVEVLKSSGRLGYILPNKFFTTDYGEGLRRLLAERSILESIVDFEDGQVFRGVGTYTAMMFLAPNSSSSVRYSRLGSVYREAGSLGLSQSLKHSQLDFQMLNITNDGSRWSLATGVLGELLTRLQDKYGTFSELSPHIFQGLKTSADKVFLVHEHSKDKNISKVTNQLGQSFEIETAILRPVVKGEHVQRYFTDTRARLFILYPYEINDSNQARILLSSELERRFPLAWSYLCNYKDALGMRDKGKWASRDDWYAYARGQNIAAFASEKFLVPYMTTSLRANYDRDDSLFFVNITTGGYGLRFKYGKHSPYYFLALLNSQLLGFCLQQLTNRFRGGYFAVNKQALERLPIRQIDFANSADRTIHDEIVSLSKKLRLLNEEVAACKTEHNGIVLKRELESKEEEIDRLIYCLYDLSKIEIDQLKPS